jgi:hypothetical protein
MHHSQFGGGRDPFSRRAFQDSIEALAMFSKLSKALRKAKTHMRCKTRLVLLTGITLCHIATADGVLQKCAILNRRTLFGCLD